MWLLLPATSSAATWTVPVDFPTITAAATAAVSGDVIVLQPGLYAEHVVVGGKALTFEGGVGVTWRASGGDALYCEAGATCTLRDIAFDGAGAFRSIDVATKAAVVVEGCTFVGGAATSGGGIRSLSGTSVVVRGSTFDGNVATTASGAHVYATGTPNVEIVESTFLAGSAAVDGGALRVNAGGSVYLADLWIEGNAAVDDGGGIDVDATPTFEMRRSLLCANTAGHEGGGVVVRDAVSTVVGNVLLANGADLGGGLLASGGDISTTNNHFVGNSAVTDGAGVETTSYQVSTNDLYAHNDGATAQQDTNATLDHVLFWSNPAGDTTAVVTASTLFADPLLTSSPPFGCEPALLLPLTGSPLVDGGDPAITDPDGTASDIGAFGGADPYPMTILPDDLDQDGFPAGEDCDDNDSEVFPGALEQCNGKDDDCDGVVPSTELDLDTDGFPACAGDCDDTSSSVHPNGLEIGCNAIDDDCSPATPDIGDNDLDGFDVCGEDCNDSDPEVYPGAVEFTADEVDQDCDGIEWCWADADLDGHGEAGEPVASDDPDCADPGEALVQDDICVGWNDEEDLDLDGAPDGCDPCPDDVSDDSDGDQVCDSDDLCPGADDRVDADGDGVPDSCEEVSPDSDGDGVPDAIDPSPNDPGGAGSLKPPEPPGCGCATGAFPSSAGGLVGVLALLAGRRRRRPHPRRVG